jgi:hypothetical protein
MQGICNTCKEFDERESTMSLRSDMELRFNNNSKALQDGRNVDLKEKEHIK